VIWYTKSKESGGNGTKEWAGVVEVGRQINELCEAIQLWEQRDGDDLKEVRSGLALRWCGLISVSRSVKELFIARRLCCNEVGPGLLLREQEFENV